MSLVQAVWKGVPGRKCMVAMQAGRVKSITWDSDVETFISAHAQMDLFFAPAGFGADKRSADQALGAGAFWLDIDCGEGKPYPDQEAGAQAITQWLQRGRMPMPSAVVSSGYGLHVWWLLAESYSREAWLEAATRLKRTAAADGLRADPVRTADIASIMRIPGSTNHKRSGRPCVVLHESEVRYTLAQINRGMPALRPTSVRSLLPDDDEDQVYPPGDPVAVVGGCQQIRNSWGKPDIPEPLWRACLSVLWRCEQGASFVQEYSKGDPRYDADEVLSKAQLTKGPLSCEQFAAACAGGCEGCPSRGAVVSPIQLRQEATVAKPPWPFDKVGNFLVRPQGILTVDEDGERVWVSANPVWVSAYREAMRNRDERPYCEVELTYRKSNGVTDHASLDAGVLADGKRFETEIRHMSMTGVYKFPSLRSYLSAHIDRTMREIGAQSAVKRYGWYGNEFCVGNRLIGPRGARECKVLATSNMFKDFTPRGSIDGWKQAVSSIAGPEYYPLQAAVLAALASPLFELCGVQAPILLLQGQTGGGKTSAAKAGLAVFGPSRPLSENPMLATEKGISTRLSTARNLPFLLDEAGPLTKHPDKIQRLFYSIVNGEGGSALTRSRDIKDMGQWWCQVIITSNQSFADLSHHELLEANRMRFLELPVEVVMPRALGARLNGADMHCGMACVPFLTRLSQMHAELKPMFTEAAAALEKSYRIPDAARFPLWGMAATAIVGAVAEEVGILPWPTAPVVEYLGELVGETTRAIKASDQILDDVVPDWLRRNSRNVTDMTSMQKLEECLAVDAPIALIQRDAIVLSRAELYEEAKRNYISTAAVRKWVGERGGRFDRCKLTHRTPAVWVAILPRNAVEI